jgi:hypothetical protein
MKYYCDGTPIGDWLGPGRYADVPLDSASRLSEFLHGLNADFFLLKEYPAGARIESDPAFGRFFEKIRTEGDYKLFRVGVAAR